MVDAGDEIVCWCFGYTRGDIADDFIRNGKSTIEEKISDELKNGGCRCAEKNPKGG